MKTPPAISRVPRSPTPIPIHGVSEPEGPVFVAEKPRTFAANPSRYAEAGLVGGATSLSTVATVEFPAKPSGWADAAAAAPSVTAGR